MSSALAGVTISRFRIIAPIGAGGMGEVYKAYDEVLGRHVALKILPESVVQSEDHLRRFTQEAKSASSLNHPAIVTVYDIGVSLVDGKTLHYIAMELIEGETLRSKITARSNLRKLLDLMVEVAEGLARAHAAGIVHRDLKPENIMVTSDWHAKIVDFGLAKLFPMGGAEMDTGMMTQTREGSIVGTVGYMAPEQIEARAVDHRSDIFSLGCVLYEVATGYRAFAADSTIDIFHKILHAEPEPIAAVNSEAPRGLQHTIERCLAKDPDERYQSVKEVAIELRRIVRHFQREIRQPAQLTAPVRGRRWVWTAALALTAAAVTAAAVSWTVLHREDSVNLSAYRFTPLETSPAYEGMPAWSPDGKAIAYVKEVEGVLQIFTRGLESSVPTRLTSMARDCREPFWSPDGAQIYFISITQDADGLWAVGAAGGNARLILPDVDTAAISPDGKTLALLRQGSEDRFALRLYFSSPPGAEPKLYTHPAFKKRTATAGSLRFTPDSSSLGAWLFARYAATPGAPREFWMIPLNGGEPHQRLQSLSNLPRTYPFSWMPDGRHIVFGAELPGRTPGFHLWLAETTTDRVMPLTATQGSEFYPTVSPDGKRIVFSSEDVDFDLVEIPIDGSPFRKLSATPRIEKDPLWSPKGSDYAFVTNRNGVEEIWLRSTKGEWERPIVTEKDFPADETTIFISGLSFSPDGQRIAFQRRASTKDMSSYRVWIANTVGGPVVPMERKSQVLEGPPSWSPDGNWIAFTAHNELQKIRVGGDEPPVILKRGLPAGGDVRWSPRGDWILCQTGDGVFLVSPDGTKSRLLSDQFWFVQEWARDGKTIYAVKGDEALHLILIRVDIQSGRETVLNDLGFAPPANFPLYGLSLSPDGKTLTSSLANLRGDLWLFEGFLPTEGHFPSFFRK